MKRKLILWLHYSTRSFITVGIVKSVSTGRPPPSEDVCVFKSAPVLFPHVQTAHTHTHTHTQHWYAHLFAGILPFRASECVI